MQKYIRIFFLLLLVLCSFLTGPTTAQTEKTLKESFADLKKSLHPDKTFILPFTDSTNEDLQAFLFAVKDTKGVNAVLLKMEKQKATITVDAKGSLMNVWNNLPKEIRNRYSISERTPQGFILTDSYQSGSVENNTITQEQNKSVIYKETESSANKDYQSTDTSKNNKSVWQQQKDYAEKMRQRDKDRANEIYGKSKNREYSNPNNYKTEAVPEKGEWYAEYTINGKKITLWRGTEKKISRNAGRNMNVLTCSFMAPQPFRQIELTITDPAAYPEIRKFEFGKPPVFSKQVAPYFKYFTETPNAEVDFRITLHVTDGDGTVYNIMGGSGSKKSKYDNIESGYFEIQYFDSKGDGILEATFTIAAKDVTEVYGKKKTNLNITNGKIRFRLDNRY